MVQNCKSLRDPTLRLQSSLHNTLKIKTPAFKESLDFGKRVKPFNNEFLSFSTSPKATGGKERALGKRFFGIKGFI